MPDAPAIATAHLFPALHDKLIELLRSLDARQWELPTVAPGWTVKDVAAHLLDTQQRLVARLRGEPQASLPPIGSNADLVAGINRLNADGVSRYRALEPPALIAQMTHGAAGCHAHYRSLDPSADASFGVSWAGEQRSPNWFHVAREFTERWHHQQQIRLAVGRPGIMVRELYHPVLDTFMHALPFTYRGKTRDEGTVAKFTVSGDSGGDWYLVRADQTWRLAGQPSAPAASETTMPQAIAWLIFTKGMRRPEAEPQIRVSGDADLGRHVLEAIAIVG